MKAFIIATLTLFAAAAALEDFGGKARHGLTETPNIATIELVYTTFANKALF